MRNGLKPAALGFVLTFLLAQFGFSGETSGTNDVLSTNQTNVDHFVQDRIMNVFLPGYYQFTHDRPMDGALSALTLPLLGLYFFLPTPAIRTVNIITNGETYLAYSDPNDANYQEYMKYQYIKMTAMVYGVLLYANSQVDMFRTEKKIPYLNSELTNLGLLDYVAAPWKPENLFNWDFFPVYPLIEFLGLSPDDYRSIGNYFQKPKVVFWNYQVDPYTGLALTIATSVLFVTANAALEELVFRDFVLNQYGTDVSSIAFGMAHLPNMTGVNVSVEDTLNQTLFATLMGYYMAFKTRDNHYDFRRMIALHFWHNVTSMALNYMVGEGKSLSLQIVFPPIQF